ncbi:MAG: hypothetical protein ABIE68_03445 [bacterium]
MLLVSEEILKRPILDESTKEEIGGCEQVLLDFDTGKVKALLIKKRAFFEYYFVTPMHISACHTGGTEVDTAEIWSLTSDEKLKKQVDSYQFLIGALVKSESGAPLGMVDEFSVHLTYWDLRKIFVGPKMGLNIMVKQFIVDHKQIVSLSPEEVIVKDSSLPVEEKGKLPEAAPSA